ncbi:probable serine/threonine-protein kinase At1g01540 isoform X2 [Prosopis cineraria]|uniref:probable serine/threonine-protein kinase At1g01540 isoform X2 n=1 Tax=Prosopis cineraria TaxID=364024 RepID=UPI00240EDEA0|nr:probable serine/threonine-protein kinase At1g01540 isoform X2 [Prosopis cineraria]
MSSYHTSSTLKANLEKPTSFFGAPLWTLFLALTAAFITLMIFIALCIWLICFRHRHPGKPYESRFSLPEPIASKRYRRLRHDSSSLDKRLLSGNVDASGILMNFDRFFPHVSDVREDGDLESIVGCSRRSKNVLGQSMEFSFQEIMEATNGLAKENVIDTGDHGIVYLGLLRDNTQVAVKMLVSHSCQTEDFALQMEVFGCIRHKKLVQLLGYCTEGGYRMPVSEYVDNGNLHQWLHEFPGQVSPLAWETRLNIIQGVAKGLAYLHEDVEPKILHGSLKSSNILPDHQWNPKISDFGLTYLFTANWTHDMMETSRSVSLLHKILSESNDIYSFGILIMEIVSGRIPVYRSLAQEHLVDWFKSKIANEIIDDLVDSKLPEMPHSKELKQMILVSLRCVDPDVNPKLKMGDVIRMLEPRDLLLSNERDIEREVYEYNNSPQSHPAPELGDSPR